MALLLLSSVSYAMETAQPAPEAPAQQAPDVTAQTVEEPASKDDFCANIKDAAADMRHVIQMQKLQELQKSLDAKLTQLEQKRAEILALKSQKDQSAAHVEKTIIEIYAKMKPDVAAAQLSLLDGAIAAQILLQLNPRTASTILNEMKPAVAATMTTRMAESQITPAPAAIAPKEITP